ncbi:MAG TPA: M50 family metallopeptidase [Bellilinea sp.]
MNFTNLLLFILFFGAMMFLHELGHYLVAKLFKIKVEEFGFGFPPRLVKLFKFQETEFSLNWIPFGAFVRLSGENDPNVEGGFGNAKPWVRIAVLLGGPLMNLATGVVLFSLIFNQVGVPDYNKVLISAVSEASPAETAGLLPGDIVVSVNQLPVESTDELSALIQANKGSEIEIVVLRDGETVVTRATPRVNPPPNEGSLGIAMTNPLVKTSWVNTVPLSFQATYAQAREIFEMPGRLIRNEIPKEQSRVVGPVGIYTMFSQARDMDQQNAGSGDPFATTFTLRLMAVITVAIGLTNLFPIPAVDGGRIIFIIPELLFRKRIPPKYENLVHMIGFVALILLMFYITAQDIFNPIQLP